MSGNKTWRRAATIGATIGNGSTPGDSHSMSSLINKLIVLRGEDANRLLFARHTFSWFSCVGDVLPENWGSASWMGTQKTRDSLREFSGCLETLSNCQKLESFGLQTRLGMCFRDICMEGVEDNRAENHYLSRTNHRFSWEPPICVWWVHQWSKAFWWPSCSQCGCIHSPSISVK